MNSLLNQQYTQTVLIKLWKIMVDLVTNDNTPPHKIRTSTIKLKVYVHFYPLFQKALGGFYHNEYYVAKPGQLGVKVVGFDRFQFDVISLSGENLLLLTDSEFQVFLSKPFDNLTKQGNFSNELPSIPKAS